MNVITLLTKLWLAARVIWVWNMVSQLSGVWVFESRILSKIFGPKSGGVRGEGKIWWEYLKERRPLQDQGNIILNWICKECYRKRDCFYLAKGKDRCLGAVKTAISWVADEWLLASQEVSYCMKLII